MSSCMVLLIALFPLLLSFLLVETAHQVLRLHKSEVIMCEVWGCALNVDGSVFLTYLSLLGRICQPAFLLLCLKSPLTIYCPGSSSNHFPLRFRFLLHEVHYEMAGSWPLGSSQEGQAEESQSMHSAGCLSTLVTHLMLQKSIVT